MARPTLTAVVPALDEAPRIGALVAALLGEVDDVVVVDGGSGDGTIDAARRAGARVITAPRGRGPQLDTGAAVAMGERLWFVHADAGLPAGAGEAIRAAGAPWGCFAVRFSPSSAWLDGTAAWMNARARRTGSATGDMGIWASADLFRRVGGFGPLLAFEDLAFTDRARAVVKPVVLEPAIVTSSRRWQRRGVARTVLQMWALRAAYRAGVAPERLARVYAAG